MAYTPSDLNQAQLDILASDLSENPLLTDIDGTPIHLTGDLPYIIPAINELKDRLDTMEGANQNFTNDYNKALGDFKRNPNLLTALQKISPTVLEALVKQYMEIHGNDLDNPTPLPQGKTIAQILNDLVSGGVSSSSSLLTKILIYSDLTTDSISLGVVKSTQMIDEVILMIDEGFDNGLLISIGTDMAQGVLMTTNDNCTDIVNQYSIECNQSFEVDTELKIFLSNYAGLTKGKCKVIIKFK